MSDGQWITVNGTHIFVKDGETPKEAVERTFNGEKQLTNEEKDVNIEEKFEAKTEKIVYAKKLKRQNTDKVLRERIQEYIDDLKNEPQISKDMSQIAGQIGSELLGFEFRVKDCEKERFMQKLKETPMKRNRDNVRYTFALGEDVSNYHKAVEQLEMKGYEQIAIKNYWKKDGLYKGINTNWRSKNGTEFEIQFHSKHNLKVKERLHPWYEKERNFELTQEERNVAREQQKIIAREFVCPKGIEEV